MIDIVLSETCEFTYDAKELAIGIWHRHLKRTELGGFITFNNLTQVEQFQEMLEFLIEKAKGGDLDVE